MALGTTDRPRRVAKRPTKRAGAPKLTGRLKDLADLRKHPTALLGDIQRHLLVKADAPSDRRQDIIHPSEMAKSDWCPRQTYYRIAGIAPVGTEKFSATMENIFDEGHTIHDKWQTRLREMGRLWGLWECLVCGFHFLATAPGQCESCGLGLLKYREIPLDAEESHLIVGHADGGVPDINSMIEIKSIGTGTLRIEEPKLLGKYQVETTEGKKIYDLDQLWKDLARPLPSHIRQANIYLWIAQQMGYDFAEMVFLYEFKANQLVKEFTIGLSDRVITPLLNNALAIKEGLEKKVAPVRPEHTGKTTTLCKNCMFFKHCYEEDSEDNNPKQPAGGSETRRKVSRSKTATRRPGNPTPSQTRQPATRPAGRRDGTRRLRTDEAVPEAERVDGPPRSPARSSGGRREVRRRSL